MDWTAAFVMLGAAVAGFTEGVVGAAFAMVALAIWAWWLDPVLAGPLAVFGALVAGLVAIATGRASFNLGRALPFIIGGLAGAPIGVALLKNVDAALFRVIVGMILLAFAVATLGMAKPPRLTFGGRVADGGVGFLGGIAAGFAGLPRPAPTFWSSLRSWKKDAQRDAMLTFSLAIEAVVLALDGAAGLIDGRALMMSALILPAMILPMLAGRRLTKKAKEPIRRKLVLVALALSGGGLIGFEVWRLVRALAGA